MSGVAISVAEIVAVSWLLLTNDVVSDAPFHTTTELLLKSWPFTVRTNPAPPAVALLGEIEVTDGVDGQEQETTGSKKIANALKVSELFIVDIGAAYPRQIGGRAECQGSRLERITRE